MTTSLGTCSGDWPPSQWRNQVSHTDAEFITSVIVQLQVLFLFLLIFGNFEILVEGGNIIWKLTIKLLWVFFWLLAILNDLIHYMEFLHSNYYLSEVVPQNGYVCKRLFWPNNALHILLVEEKVDNKTNKKWVFVDKQNPTFFDSFCHSGW